MFNKWRQKRHQNAEITWRKDAPLMISGARYSWVPTKDMERAPVGSAISSGSGETYE